MVDSYHHQSAEAAGPLGLGAFAGLVYRMGTMRATGVLTVFAGVAPPEVLVLRRGHLMAADTDALGRRTKQRLARLASLSDARYTFDSGTVAYPPGAINRQFSLAAWARSHFEAQIDAQGARALVEELTGALLSVPANSAPDPGVCDATDQRILEALATPQRLDQVWHHARTPRYRLLAFLHFLRCVDALQVVRVDTGRTRPATGKAAAPALDPTADKDSARRILGVSLDADRAAVKRAYRRLARALHPDLHPHLSGDQRRRLERELCAVTDAYSALEP